MEIMKVESAVDLLVTAATKASNKGSLNLQTSGDPHYQPSELKPYLGYDQRVRWQIIVEWYWMLTLAKTKIMPTEDADLLMPLLLAKLLKGITTTKVTKLEREKTKHDILALLALMRRILPKQLHRWLHLGLTSYDVISTAFALQAKFTFSRVFVPKIEEVDVAWRSRIVETASVLQIGRTHLQDALPVTVGNWLAVLHHRFVETAESTENAAVDVTGKFSGAVGTSAAIKVLFPGVPLEADALELLGIIHPGLCTQIPPPEAFARFYFEMTLLSGALANFGDDVRHLQSSAIGEITTASSTSSTMSHKGANPIAAEQVEGMHVSVRGEFGKVLETLGSTLQRDLRYSNVMRGFNAIMVFTYQQLLSTSRILGTLKVDKAQCHDNFWANGRLVVAELLHLSLQKAGYGNAHEFVNKKLVPAARKSGNSLSDEMDVWVRRSRDKKLKAIWHAIPGWIKFCLGNPDEYLGDAVQNALDEGQNDFR